MALFMAGSMSTAMHAQLSRGGLPLEPGAGMDELVWIQIENVRDDMLLLEDEWAAMSGKKNNRIAKELPCLLGPEDSGSWHTHANGTRIWQLGIQGDGARALGLVFDRFYLEPGVKLYVFDPARVQILGAYTSLNNKASRMLPVSYIQGGELLVQIEVPADRVDYGDIRIGAVRHAYRPVFDTRSEKDGSFGLSGSCNIDINCPEGDDWQHTKRAVVRMLSTENCTGVLINNTFEDGKAYVLTAAHCMFNWQNGTYNHSVFYFNYESPYCEGPDGIDYHSISGARLVATGDTSENETDADSLDFALLELSIAPPDSLTPHFAGWNHSSTPPSSSSTIHHPRADVMKISQDHDAALTNYHTYPYFRDLKYGSFWRIGNWERGTTEAGSSGAPLFNQSQQVVGMLTGGQASCSFNVNDYFTRFDLAWDYYPDSLRQLKYWLDPAGTGTVSLGAYDPAEEGTYPEDRDIKIYPNPAHDRLTLKFREPALRDAEIRIYNTSGSLVSMYKMRTWKSTSIHVGNLAQGIYILQIKADKKVNTERLIIYR